MRYLIVAFLLLAGCEAKERRQPKAEKELAKVIDQGNGESELIRYEDPELNIICYRVRNHDGIGCMRKLSPEQQVQQ